jgi:hypothetical protein
MKTKSVSLLATLICYACFAPLTASGGDADSAAYIFNGPISGGSCSDCVFVGNHNTSRAIMVNIVAQNQGGGSGKITQTHMVAAGGHTQIGLQGGVGPQWSYSIQSASFVK